MNEGRGVRHICNGAPMCRCVGVGQSAALRSRGSHVSVHISWLKYLVDVGDILDQLSRELLVCMMSELRYNVGNEECFGYAHRSQRGIGDHRLAWCKRYI